MWCQAALSSEPHLGGDFPHLGAIKREAEITHVYGREEAQEVIERSRKDYGRTFGDLKKLFESLKTS
jgi:hypothetical protein